MAAIVEEATALASRGVRELNLIAQDLTAYGRDLNPPSSLAGLLRAVARVDGLRWIRLLYCYPNFVSDELLDAIAELPQVVKYIDMPLQHADDGILRAMRRERSGAALERLLDRIRIRIPEVTLRTSFIVGFPGETEAAFERLVDFVRCQRFDRVGVFTYSREENTAAYHLPDQVPARRMIGREVEVVVESEAPGGQARLRGRWAGQAPDIDGMVLLHGAAEPGEFVRARVEKAYTYDLHARVLDAIESDAIESVERSAFHA
jgi:ribosomal protein S12 methylthiotransferase